ncbi:MAG TPA: hypothetical protein VGE83_11355 [Terracidiphilus sp.]
MKRAIRCGVLNEALWVDIQVHNVALQGYFQGWRDFSGWTGGQHARLEQDLRRRRRAVELKHGRL